MNRFQVEPEGDSVQPLDANVAALMVQLLDTVARRPAFRVLDRSGETRSVITFDRLHQMVGAVAGGLRDRGIGPGSRVVVFVPMSVPLYVTLLSVLRLGAVATFIEPWGGRKVVDEAARLVDADAFVGIPKSFLLRLVSPALRRVPLAVSTGSRRLPGTTRFADLLATPPHARVATSAVMGPDDPALVTFTTGSTGTPKGTNRTHEVLLAQHHALAREVGEVDELASVWTNLPVVVLHNLARGVETVLPAVEISQDPSPDPRLLHQLVSRSKATILAVSPAPLRQLSRSPGGAPIAAIEHVFTGGGPVSPKLLDAASAVLPKATITAMYGSTEAEPIAHATAEEVLARRAEIRTSGGIYVGHEVRGVDLRIIRIERGPIAIDDGSELADWEVATGAPGEVVVAGSHVNREYWRNPEAVRQNKIVDEVGRVWHRTGDVARRDSDGGLWLLGRAGARWSLHGRQVWALEVETPIADLPEVERAAMCMPSFSGADREFKNASAVLAVEPAAGFTRSDARDAAIRNLRARGLAATIEVRSLKSIPVDRRHGTKIDVAALQEQLKPENQDDY